MRVEARDCDRGDAIDVEGAFRIPTGGGGGGAAPYVFALGRPELVAIPPEVYCILSSGPILTGLVESSCTGGGGGGGIGISLFSVAVLGAMETGVTGRESSCGGGRPILFTSRFFAKGM